jgi:hypothetical protein
MYIVGIYGMSRTKWKPPMSEVIQWFKPLPKIETPEISSDTLRDAAFYRDRGNMVMAKVLHKLGATRAFLDATKLIRERIGTECRILILDGESSTVADTHYRDAMAKLGAQCDAFCTETWAKFNAEKAA